MRRRARTERVVEARDYRMLAEFRYLLRCFMGFSEQAARARGLTSRQHQALLTIKGLPPGAAPTIGYLAERLRITHHGAVELADRLEEAGLVRRARDAEDRRRVRLSLTPAAERQLRALSSNHLAELRRLRPALLRILEEVGEVD